MSAHTVPESARGKSPGPPRWGVAELRAGAIRGLLRCYACGMIDRLMFLAMITVFTIMVAATLISSRPGYPQATGIFPQVVCRACLSMSLSDTQDPTGSPR